MSGRSLGSGFNIYPISYYRDYMSGSGFSIYPISYYRDYMHTAGIFMDVISTNVFKVFITTVPIL